MLRLLSRCILLASLLTIPGQAAASECSWPELDGNDPMLARTDQTAGGNRIVGGCGPLVGEVTDVEIGGSPLWVLPDPTDRGDSWLVVLEDGTVEHVIATPGMAPLISATEIPALAPSHPPLAEAVDGQLVVGSALTASGRFEAPIPDARVTETVDGSLAALSGPTRRYPHGALGDDLEGAAIDVLDHDGHVVRIEVSPDEVIEGTSAMVLDRGEDASGAALLVTVSDADVGARLRLYDLDGHVVAESPPIGRGFRWMHQLASGPIGPGGEVEIVAVRTPHIGGVVEAYRLDRGRLVLVASQPGYSSHRLGSAELDMGLLADVDGDGRPEVVVPSQDMGALGVLSRSRDGFAEIGRLELQGTLATNVAATRTADGGLALAAGTTDGRLRIFR